MITIREARESDAAVIHGLIRDLAEYERLLDTFRATEEDVRRLLFGPRPFAEVLLAESDVAAVGFALFFHNVSTFRAEPGIYLEDLYVRADCRGRGAGRALLQALARLAVERGCGRLEWAVLNWNEPAIGFYQRLGAVPMNEWSTYRLTGDALNRLAQ